LKQNRKSDGEEILAYIYIRKKEKKKRTKSKQIPDHQMRIKESNESKER